MQKREREKKKERNGAYLGVKGRPKAIILGDIILDVEASKECTKKLLELINIFARLQEIAPIKKNGLYFCTLATDKPNKKLR